MGGRHQAHLGNSGHCESEYNDLRQRTCVLPTADGPTSSVTSPVNRPPYNAAHETTVLLIRRANL